VRILYVAKHDSGDNDDEGAIANALENLGHEVIKVHEKPRHRPKELRTVAQMNLLKADLCLFHKWPDTKEINQVSSRRKALWYFDLVASDDKLIVERAKTRIEWFMKIEGTMDHIFCTDGDWVYGRNGDDEFPLYTHLMQGADHRKLGRGTVDPNLKYPPILFAGMVNHGSLRVAQIEYLKERFGDRLWLLGDGGPKYRKHGRELANIVANVRLVLCPAGPVTDRYFSNRIFQMGGFGAFTLHPYSRELLNHYELGVDCMAYDPNDHKLLGDMIEEFIADGYREEREKISDNILRRTIARNTYQHRVIEMMQTIENGRGE
jgi:hypothetical protein